MKLALYKNWTVCSLAHKRCAQHPRMCTEALPCTGMASLPTAIQMATHAYYGCNKHAAAKYLCCRLSQCPAYMHMWAAEGARAPQAVPGTLHGRPLVQRCCGHFGQMAPEKAGVVYLQRRLPVLHTVWPRHIPVVDEAGVPDDSGLPSPIEIYEPHIHATAIHSPACLQKATYRQT